MAGVVSRAMGTERDAGTRESQPAADPQLRAAPGGGSGLQACVIALQQSAGNAAVARYVQNLANDPIGPAPPRDVIPDSRDPRARMGAEGARLGAKRRAGSEIPGIVVCLAAEPDDILDTEHHWIEMGGESYGWWPSRRVEQGVLAGGVPGILNGTTLGGRGTATRDPHHGDPAQRFTVVDVRGSYELDDGAATASASAAIRDFARTFRGQYTWNPLGTDCHEFVADALAVNGLARSNVHAGARPRP